MNQNTISNASKKLWAYENNKNNMTRIPGSMLLISTDLNDPQDIVS